MSRSSECRPRSSNRLSSARLSPTRYCQFLVGQQRTQNSQIFITEGDKHNLPKVVFAGAFLGDRGDVSLLHRVFQLHDAYLFIPMQNAQILAEFWDALHGRKLFRPRLAHRQGTKFFKRAPLDRVIGIAHSPCRIVVINRIAAVRRHMHVRLDSIIVAVGRRHKRRI